MTQDLDDLDVGDASPAPVLLHDAAHVWHPYTQHLQRAAPAARQRAPRGRGCSTPTGRPVLDAISSWWVTTHGHCHPDIVARWPSRPPRSTR